jgi:hypothetical protein
MHDATPSPPQPTIVEDPTLGLMQTQAQAASIAAAQQTAQIDTSRLMAIYGTRLALGNPQMGSPLSFGPAASLGAPAAGSFPALGNYYQTAA